MWTRQGLNLWPPDYESVALTNWATSPISLAWEPQFLYCGCKGTAFSWTDQIFWEVFSKKDEKQRFLHVLIGCMIYFPYICTPYDFPNSTFLWFSIGLSVGLSLWQTRSDAAGPHGMAFWHTLLYNIDAEKIYCNTVDPFLLRHDYGEGEKQCTVCRRYCILHFRQYIREAMPL